MRELKRLQTGVMLIEALIGILIFSLGILALVGLQAASISATGDAQYRIAAVNLANQMMADIWTGVDRSNDASLTTSLTAFAHQTSGDSESCDFSGSESDEPAVTAWTNLILTGEADGEGTTPMLPGAQQKFQQIAVNLGANHRVTITICWQNPSDKTVRRHVLISNIY